jgi:NADPH-dependent 2,4-dienoyl-CoA reductase/sulfur reductase-like enzyme/nitrite reductase/ring-hydroxylating ferredoxin subunit
MGSQSSDLKGPDLAAGVALGDIPDGGSLLGHAGGEPVLLVKQGGELFAVGATCTHYSGPLAEGLVVGDTVRCPWHHACFSLRTGEATRAPALNPIPCYRVERQGDRVAVGEKLVAPPRSPTAHTPATVVILGGGAAGHAAAEMLRREGHGGRIVMVSADTDPPVDRPNLSKDYLAGNAPEEWIPLRPPEFFEEQRIELMLGTRVLGLDVKARRLDLEGGRTLAYDALLLCTGATPIRLPIPGADLPHVHTLRTLRDSRAIIAAAGAARRALVLGASFIGLEAAASLRARGLEVHVVAPEARPLERVLGAALGDFVRALHEEKGVVFHLGRTPRAIAEGEVLLDDGSRLAADLVVMGVGVRPDVELAAAAGLAVDRGVLVDEQLATSAPGVWAAGDIASFVDPIGGGRLRVEHWVVAERQGQTAARNILGQKVRYADVPFFWSAHYDVVIAYVGHADPARAEIAVEGDLAARDAKVTFREGGKVAAVATVFRDRDSLLAEVELERRMG